MSVTEQHFQLMTTLEKTPARSAQASRPSWVLAASWVAAVASAAVIGGVAGAVTGGIVLFAIPAAWMAFEMHHPAADTPA
ncbi:MAG: hypothetical protein ACSHXK_02090 [Oceanococcus sp.]